MDADAAKTALLAIDFDGLLRGNSLALRAAQLPENESSKLNRQYLNSEIDLFHSVNQIVPNSMTLSELAFERFLPIKMLADRAGTPTAASGAGLLKFQRKKEPKGPLAVFGYDYFEAERAKLAYVKKPQVLEYQGLWGGGEEYAYEVLNFADGKRNAQEIRDAVSAEYGPVPLEMVIEYLKALEKIGVVELVK
jgi:hypothetical protein